MTTHALTRLGKQPAAAPSVNVHEIERLGSALLGGGLVVCGARRGSLSGLLLAAIGGGFVYRGISGHCNVYQQLGINTAKGAERQRQYPHGAAFMSSIR